MDAAIARVTAAEAALEQREAADEANVTDLRA
jgi:hypothetical protein